MVWGRVLTVLDSPVQREEAKWSSTPKSRPPWAAGSRCACHLSGLLKTPIFFKLTRRLTKQRLQATPTPLVMLLQSPSVPTGHEERESSQQSSCPNKSQRSQMTISCQRNPVYGNSANFTVSWQQSLASARTTCAQRASTTGADYFCP